MVTTNEQIRQACETIIRSSGSYQYGLAPGGLISHSHSLTTIPSIQAEYVMSEDLLAGRSVQGKMSNVRRFFCLFITFDLAFIGLMWLICTMINGESIHTAFEKQIYHYSIYTSLFDIVLAAICRFTVLLLFYGLLGINHWVVIAWVDSHQPVFDVLLILASFVISWGEAWFLDFKVIPQELGAQHFIDSHREDEREPLVRSYVDGLPDRYAESTGNFYSPLVSPEPSIHGGDYQKKPVVKLSSKQETDYKLKGVETLQECSKLLGAADWKLDKSKGNDKIYIISKSKYGKLFKIEASIDVSPRFLLEELFYRAENVPQWNPSLVESRKVHTFDEHTDIMYQKSSDVPAISCRDFVNVRHWDLVNDYYIIAYCAVEFSSIPVYQNIVRGENIIGCWAMGPVEGKTDVCHFQWILNTKLKGWIPTSIVDRACTEVMFDFIKHLRIYLKSLKQSS